jgi:hypothetical protein
VKIKISSMYTTTTSSSMRPLNRWFIIDWNVAGELHNPKNMTVGSNSPLCVLKAAFH